MEIRDSYKEGGTLALGIALMMAGMALIQQGETTGGIILLAFGLVLIVLKERVWETKKEA